MFIPTYVVSAFSIVGMFYFIKDIQEGKNGRKDT